MAQLMPLPLTVSCFSKIQIGFTFLDSYGLTRVVLDKGPLNVCVCVCVCVCEILTEITGDYFLLHLVYVYIYYRYIYTVPPDVPPLVCSNFFLIGSAQTSVD